MRKKLFFGILLCMSSFLVFSEDTEKILDRVDFDQSIKSLNQEKKAERSDLLILDGAIASIDIKSRKGKPFEAEVLLIDGEWDGLEKVDIYQVLLLFKGDEHSDRFPRRPPREINNKELVLLNQHVMVMALHEGFRKYRGRDIPVLHVLDSRIIK